MSFHEQVLVQPYSDEYLMERAAAAEERNTEQKDVLSESHLRDRKQRTSRETDDFYSKSLEVSAGSHTLPTQVVIK